jgi:hypothetical protein
MALIVVIVPTALGAWADFVDFSDLVKNGLTKTASLQMSFVAIVLVGYLFLQGCWVYRDEEIQAEQIRNTTTITELKCQREFLVNFLSCIRTSIGNHASRMNSCAIGTESDTLSSVISVNQKELLEVVLIAICNTFKTIPTVPADSRMGLVLFREKMDFLTPVASYNGERVSFFLEEEYNACCQHFNLRQADASVAVRCASTKTVCVVEDADQAHRDPKHPFKYFSNESKQREDIGSMICMPFDIGSGASDIWVLCVTCSACKAFLEAHEWKAKAVQTELAARVRMLISTHDLLVKLARFAAKNGELATQRGSAIQSLEKNRSLLERKLQVLERQSSLHCAPRPWLGVKCFCFSESATVGLFNDRKVCALPFFLSKMVDLGHLCADLQTRHRVNRFRSVRCMTTI